MAGRAAVGDVDSPVRVVVTPSQSSYFAGEPFSVTITFTNTRTSEAGPSKVSAPTHKRGAHSISSAPLARPPTSPGTPRSAIVPSQSRTPAEELPRRKGIIGKARPLLPQGSDLIEHRRKRQLAQKSLSVSISAYEFENNILEASSAPPTQRSFQDQRTPTSSHIPSPLARTDALSLANGHPHARKHSLLDGQFSLDVLSPTTSVPPSPYSPSPNSSTSTFSLALDPIAESTHSPYPSTPAIGSPTIEPVSFPSTSHTPPPPPNSVYGYPPPRSATSHHRPAPIGLGQPSTASRAHPQQLHPRTAFASTFPPSNTELILYSYAQLTGTVVLTPVPGVPPTPDQARTLGTMRSTLLNRSVLGGGSMDITAMLHSPTLSGPGSPRPGPRQRQTHSRSSSFGAGLMSMLSPTGLVSGVTSPTPSGSAFSRSKWRASSSAYGTPPQTPTSARMLGSGSNPNVGGFPNGNIGDDISPEEPLPTYEIQPAMLAVDLTLAPGQSRSYTYTVKLPDNLPPTFKGKALKFSYELIVGTCRAGPTSGSGAVSANSISRVMKVPIRIYNHVSVGRFLKPYDLLWPVSRRQDVGMPGTEAKVVEHTPEAAKGLMQPVLQLPSSATPTSPLPSDTLSSIRDYAQSLLDSLPPEEDEEESESGASAESSQAGPVNGHGNGHANGHPSSHRGQKKRVEELRSENDSREAHQEDGILSGCREAVEVLTRNPKKASYDVNKDGVKVAVLTFTKSAYRLGETISGVVEVNERSSRARVLKLSAILESHEALPSSLSPTSSARHLRRSHAEFHASFTLNTLRTSFALDIPSDASPAFQIRVGTPPNPAYPSSPPNSSFSSSSSSASVAARTPGGLEWKVRMCLLVGIAAETSSTGALQPEGVRFKSLVRDGPRGEWGSSWRAPPTSAPLEKPDLKAEARRQQLAKLNSQSPTQQEGAGGLLTSPRLWSRYIMGTLLYGGLGEDTEREYHDGDILDGEADGEGGGIGGVGGGYDGIIPDLGGGVGVGVDYGGGEEGWREVRLETVECEVPVKVFPGNTAFKALDVVFDV